MPSGEETKVTPLGISNTACVPLRPCEEPLRTFKVYVSCPPGTTEWLAERRTRKSSERSGLVTTNLSRSAEGPVAGAETTLPVVGSNSVSGMGSFRGVPFTSVPNGAGLDEVAEDDEVSGSVIWYSVSLSSPTTTSAKENTLALNFVVIFGPLPAPVRTGENAALVRLVSSQDAGPLGNINPASVAVPVAESS